MLHDRKKIIAEMEALPIIKKLKKVLRKSAISLICNLIIFIKIQGQTFFIVNRKASNNWECFNSFENSFLWNRGDQSHVMPGDENKEGFLL